jgi:hypothetical protein
LEFINVGSKKLTTFSALKNVSLIRYILCRRRNKIKAFYEQAKCVIYKCLSVEVIFSYLIEFLRLKKYLLTKDSDMRLIFGSERNKLVLGNEEKINKEKLKIDELIDNMVTFNICD